MLQILFEWFDSFLFITLLAVGFTAGRIAERRHYRSIRIREVALRDVLVFSNRFPPPGASDRSRLVSGSVVVAEDYFKRVLASLYSLLGGRLKSYESLLDRARREAVLRMKREARDAGSEMIVNAKFQSLAIPGRSGNTGAVEILVYGTAVLSASNR